jgi:nucleoside-diphosphate-sugar epimerase
LVAESHLGYQGQVVRATSSDPEYLTDNPNRRRPSIAKARAELGYQPQVAIEEGLLRTLLWYRDVAQTDMEVQ